MSKVRVACFALSLDGYGAGPRQDLQNPLGVGGLAMMEWFLPTRTWRSMQGESDGETGVDDTMAAAGFADVGAWMLGRNMFGPVRGPWPDDNWKGWWGDEPPYHCPVFVLTHHARPTAARAGDEFHFVTRWHPRGARSGEGRGGRPRRAHRRRRLHGAPVSAGRPHRRDASCGRERRCRRR